MPWKLIGFIIALIVIVTFIGFNATTTTDIRIWFGDDGVLNDIPIFVSFFVMYLVGVVSVIPFLFGWKRRHRLVSDDDAGEDEPVTKEKRRSVRILGGRKKKQAEQATVPDEKDASESSSEVSGEIPPQDE